MLEESGVSIQDTADPALPVGQRAWQAASVPEAPTL
jgi:hypothetical protein